MSGKDHTSRFVDLAKALASLQARSFILDGESPYVGGRTLKWLKVKQAKFREQERGFYKPDKPLRSVAAGQPTGPPLGS